MSTKAIIKSVSQPKKDSSKKQSPAPTAGKSEKKAATTPNLKTEEKMEPIENEVEAPGIDLEEQEEQEDAAAASASGQNGNAAALAAATGSTEMSASFKNFRHHPDMENFYRFIYENDLRHEALAIIDEIMIEKQARRLGKPTKTPGY